MEGIEIGNWVMVDNFYPAIAMKVVDLNEDEHKVGCRYELNGTYILEYFFTHELVEAEGQVLHKFDEGSWVMASSFSLSPVMQIVKQNRIRGNVSNTCRYLKDGIFHTAEFKDDELRQATDREALFHSPRKKSIGISPA